MEKIEYREATFDVIRTLSCERTRVRDAANNYLHTHHEFTVEVNYQPVLAAYTLPPGTLNPIASPGALPGETDLALLSRMLQPRGLLRVTAGGSVILESPAMSQAGRLPCDVKGGPSVEVVGVPAMIGFKHWVVTLKFVADVRDLDEVIKSAVISNLWVGEESIDVQRRSVRRFAGRAILRADVMRQQNVNANSFRDLYLFKCPEHYQRQNVNVQLSEDGTILTWSFEDTMRGYDLGQTSQIVEIECFRTGYVKAGSPHAIAVDALRSAGRVATNDPASSFLGLTALPGAAFVATLENMPRSYVQCRCDLTGDRNANLGRLSAIALGVCMNQVGFNISALLTGTAELIFRQDIADKVYTSCELTVRWTDDALFTIAGAGAILDSLAGDPLDATVARLQLGAAQTVTKFLTDSRSLSVFSIEAVGAIGFQVPPDARNLPNVAADRSGASFNLNPPLTQGAFGVIPQGSVPENMVGFVPTGQPIGSVQPGIEALIVQALLGQNQTPPRPTTLLTES